MALCFYAVTEVLILSGHLQVPRSPLGDGAAREALGATWYSAETLGIRVGRMAPWRRRCLGVAGAVYSLRLVLMSWTPYSGRPRAPSSRGTTADWNGPLNTLGLAMAFL